MTGSVPITPGSGRNIAAEGIAGQDFQVVKLTVGADGVEGDRIQGARAPGGDADFGLFVRELSEENAYTQELLNTLVQLLRSVWQMGSAAGAPSLTVRNPNAADFQVTIPTNAAMNVSQVGSQAAHTVVGNTAPAISAASQLVVAQSQQYHPASLPNHIYANIQV